MIFRTAQKCPLCESPRFEYKICFPSQPKEFRLTGVDEIIYALCGCGLIYHWLPMTDETAAEYYKGQYRETLGTSEVRRKNIEEEIIKATKILKLIDGVPSSVLDIGCSTGILLDKLRRAYKCNVMGIEPSDAFREYGHKLGLNVLGKIDDLNGNQKFDLITAIHVLEHIIEPVAFLEKVREFIAEGGKLIAEVPLLHQGLPHPIVFTEKTFRAMLNKAGFAIDRLVVDNHATALAIKSSKRC